jgi:hypothetical protein
LNTTAHPTERRKLNSWKEIADYLQRDVRTVTRWEREKGLPVHRNPGIGRQSVFAFADEIDAWLKEPAPMAAYAATPNVGAAASPRRWLLVAGAILLVGMLGAVNWVRVRTPAAEPVHDPVLVPSLLRFAWPRGSVEFVPRRLELGAHQPIALLVAKFNGDEIPDLLTIQGPDAVVAVMLGRGDGGFRPPTLYPTCNSLSYDGAADDLDGDGAVDLIVPCHETRRVRVLWGHSDRPFQDHTDVLSDSGPRTLGIADLNGDGRLDIVVGNMLAGTASVFMNRGGRKFSARSIPLLDGVCHITVHDMDNDGKLDIVASSANTPPIILAKGRGDGTFDPPREVTPFRGGLLHLVAELDGDRFPEIVSTDAQGEIVVVRGKTTTVDRVDANIAGWFAMLAGDFNNDGHTDVLGSLAWQNRVLMLAGEEQHANLVSAGSQPIGRYPGRGATADFNGDGLLDAAFPVTHESAVVVLIQNKTKR